MDKYGWVLLLCFVILMIAVVTLSILRFAKQKKSVVYLAPPFSELFLQMRNTDDIVLVDDKAFRITSAGVVAPTHDAFVLNDNTTQTQIPNSQNLVGFVFSSFNPITVTSFQILASSVVATRTIPRNMAIYDVDSKTQLALSVVDPNRDYIDANGFYTAELATSINLQANKQYVLIAQSVPFDILPLHTAQTGVAFTSPIVFVSGAQSNNTSDIDYPSVVPSDAPVFASFQFRETTTGVATVFGVDPSNGGFPSSPQQYMNGFIASVPDSGTFVLVQPGIAAAEEDGVSSIVLQQPTKIFTNRIGLNGLDVGTFIAETWYYIYVISSDVMSLPTGCLMSLNRVTPQRMPDGYTHSRRIGTARTTSSATTFYAMQQENLGRRRTTFFLGDAELRNFVTDGLPSDDFTNVPLTFVPPTATVVSVSVRGREFSSLSPPTLIPINAILEFHPALDIQNVMTLGISDAVVTYGQIDVPLNNAVLPQSIAYKLLPKPGTGGSIPDQVSPFEQFRINCSVVKYVEIL